MSKSKTEHTDRYSDENITILLFEATSVSATVLKDKYKYGAKKWFELWWKSGLNLWKELNIEIKNQEFGEVAEDMKDDDAAAIYELAKEYLINKYR